MWAAVLAVCLHIADVVAQECGSSSDQKVGLVAAGAATAGHGGFTALRGTQAASTFVRGDSTYAIVVANDQSSIQIVDVSDPSNPVAVSSATDGHGGFTELGGPWDVSTFVRGDSTYAIVAAGRDDGIQIVDVSDPSNPVAVSSATDGEGGFTTLHLPHGVSTFVRGGSTYAIVVTTGPGSGIQIVDVSDPSNPVAVASATDGEGGFTTLQACQYVSTFVRGDSTYAIVASYGDNGFQLVSIPDCGAQVPAFDCLSHVFKPQHVDTPGLEFCLIHWTPSYLPNAHSCLRCRICPRRHQRRLDSRCRGLIAAAWKLWIDSPGSRGVRHQHGRSD